MSSELINVIVSIITGVATCIPLVIALISYVQKAIKSKNWANLLKLVSDLMIEAEEKFKTGAERKQFVMSMVQISASSINFEIDMEAVSLLIDSLATLTKKVNVKS